MQNFQADNTPARDPRLQPRHMPTTSLKRRSSQELDNGVAKKIKVEERPQPHANSTLSLKRRCSEEVDSGVVKKIKVEDEHAFAPPPRPTPKPICLTCRESNRYCNGGSPSCSNCEIHKSECVYVIKPSPGQTNVRGAPPPPTQQKPVCLECRGAVLHCDSKSPCNNCAPHMLACTYVPCPRGKQCKIVGCCDVHGTAEEESTTRFKAPSSDQDNVSQPDRLGVLMLTTE